jgi:hypothetical protein
LGGIFAFVLSSTSISAQDAVVAYNGSEIFCHVLKHLKLEPINRIEDLDRFPTDETMIVIFGDLSAFSAVRQHAPNLDDYAWLLASDRPTGRLVPSRQKNEGARVVGSHLGPWNLVIPGTEVNQRPESAFRRLPRCPLLKEGLDAKHPIFRGLNRGLATNAPSYLVSPESSLHLLASFSSDCFAFDNADLRRPHTGYIFGTPAASKSRTLVVAGHGVFMNGMLAQFESDNFLFAVNAVRWLRDSPQGKRKYALMIHDRRVIDSFDLPLTAPPQLPLPPVQVINRMLRELEDEGIFHRFLEEAIGWPTVLRLALLIGTSGLLLYGFYRLFLTRHLHEHVPLIVGFTPAPPDRPVTQQRQLELLAQDNLWEPAQALARQWFLDHAGIDAPLWDEAAMTPVPAARYRAGWWTRQKLAQQIRELWSFAVRDPAQRVTLREFGRLTEVLQALTGAFQAGRLTFARGKSLRE